MKSYLSLVAQFAFRRLSRILQFCSCLIASFDKVEKHLHKSNLQLKIIINYDIEVYLTTLK